LNHVFKRKVYQKYNQTFHKYLKDFVAKAKQNDDEERLSDEEELRERE